MQTPIARIVHKIQLCNPLNLFFFFLQLMIINVEAINLPLNTCYSWCTCQICHQKTLYDTWEIFKLLMKRYRCHRFTEMDTMKTFSTGLKLQTHMLLDASSGGTMKIKIAREIIKLIDNMSLNEYHS